MPSPFPFGSELAVPTRWCATAWLAVVCALAAGSAGCTHHTLYAAVPKPVPPKRILAAAPAPPDIQSYPPADTDLAIVSIAFPEPPPGRNEHTPPAAPRSRAADPAAAPRPVAPQILPQISPADQAAAERRTNDSIGVAEKNLQQAYAHQLTSAQQDMVEKIKAFIGQAREALQDSDFLRAQNLAQKAQLLSSELVNTL